MKKVFKFIKKYQLIIFLAIIALLMGGYQLFFMNEGQQKTELLTPTPTPTIKITPQQSEKGISKEQAIDKLLDEFPLTPSLPYPENDANVVYTAPLTLEIRLKKTDNIERREKILDWIRAQGIDPQTHKITWRPSHE